MRAGVQAICCAARERDERRGYRCRKRTGKPGTGTGDRDVRRRAHAWAALSVFTGLVLALVIFGVTSHADEKGTQEYKYYTSVLVTGPEQTQALLEQYAENGHYRCLQDYLREVRSINHLPLTDTDSLEVAPGNYIILPYYSSEYSF